MNAHTDFVTAGVSLVLVILALAASVVARRLTRNRKASYAEYLLHRRDGVKLGDMDVE